MNAIEIEKAISDLAVQPFDRAEFPFAFLEAFGRKANTLKQLRAGSTNASDLPGGVLQRNNIHIATCDLGTVDDTLKALRESPRTSAAKAKFILATDGEEIQAEDLVHGESIACRYTELPDRFGAFLALAGITTVKQIRENSFDIRATRKLNDLYVELLEENPDWATAERRPDMNHFMARLIFCFFAEDTDIFNGEGLFTSTVERFSERDGSNTHEIISNIFRAMDTPTRHEGKLDDRHRKAANIPPHADAFPYVNGALFSGSIEVPRFNQRARILLAHIGGLNWKQINPDIFGSMIQAVADDEERGSLGMHYTSVPNILKVLNPLFLDDLRAKLDEARDNARKLLNLRSRMAKIRVFDPACGSGNFLVIAYKQMRAIEAEINKLRGEPDRRSEIPLTNFRGIELRDFPAEIARLALIIAEYQCDVLYRGQKEALAEFLPLDSQNWITCGNALRLDWLSICPPTGMGVRVRGDDLLQTPLDQSEINFENAGGETYICGNPPYLGGKKQDDGQKDGMKSVFGASFPYKNLDYICAFFEKASLCLTHANAAAFVTTSSINQGSHVPTLWPRLRKRGTAIAFAYAPFKWANNAKNNAGVYVTILGIENAKRSVAILFEGETKREVPHINSYLTPSAEVIVQKESAPISPLARIITGNAAYDAQHLRVEPEERAAICAEYPAASALFRPAAGTSEIINGERSWCLWIDDAQLELALSIPAIRSRIEAVKAYRASGGEVARTLANRSHQFRFRNVGKRSQVIVPQVCSVAAGYLPVQLSSSEVIVTHLAHVMFDAPLHDLSIISSRMHYLWAETLSGKHGNGLRYGSNLCWNTFPLPAGGLTQQNKADLIRCAEDILLAREAHFPMTIAELYDPKKMPENLRHAHDRNDEVLERIYIGRRFKNDTERLEKLFELYTRMTNAKAA